MGMTYCEYCQEPLTANAGFCGNCGKKIRGQSNVSYPANLSAVNPNDSGLITYQTTLDDDAPTGISEGILSYNTPPTLLTPQNSYPSPVSHSPSGGNWEQQVYYPISNKEEEEDTIALSPFWSSAPAQGNAPFVQGTPQVGNAPFVQGPLPGGSLTPHPQLPHLDGLAPQAFHQLDTIAAPPHHPHTPPPPTHHTPGVHHPHHPHHSSQTPKKRRIGCFATIASVVVIAIVIATFLITSLLHGHGRLSPVVTIGGNVIPGGNLSVHGSNFTAGGNIDITIDGQPAHLTAATTLSPRSSVPSMNLAGAYQPLTGVAGTTIAVRNDGTFDALVALDSTWTVGSKHILRTVEQSSNLSAQTVIIVPQIPTLVSCSQSTTTTSLTLGPVTEGQTQPVSAPFTLCATGTGIVNWNASWNAAQAPWLQLPASGQIQAPLTQQIQIGAMAGSLKAGTYTTTITFKSQNSTGDLTVNVTFDVRAAHAAECINTNISTLTFGAIKGQPDPATQSVTITNCGTAHPWTATASTDNGTNWLTVSAPTNGGNTLKAQASQDVAISVTSANLQPGNYTGQVTFKIGTNNATVNITFTVQPAHKSDCISAVPPMLTFTAIQGQANPPAQKTTIGNCGSTGTWNATQSTTDGTSWLNIDTSNGSLNANTTRDIAVSVTSASLQQGTYTGQIVFSLGASNVTVSVILTVQVPQAKPCLSVSSQSLTFTGTIGQSDPSAQSETLTNCGPAGTWTGADTSNNSWLRLNPATGTLNAGATQDVSVAVSLTNLAAGTYNTNIVFNMATNTGSFPVSVAVTFIVQPQPSCLNVSTQSLSFSATQGQADAAPQTVRLTNCGPAGTWTGTPSTIDGTNWLFIKPNSGSLAAGATQDVTVGTTMGKLSPGSYTGSIVFSDGTSSQTVNVSFTVSPPPTPSPAIQLSGTTLTYTAGCSDPPTQTITVSNTGGGTLTWTVGVPSQSWLTVTGSTSATPNQPGTLTFTVSSRGLSNGSTSATVDITPSNGPIQTVTVNLTVQCIG